MRMPSSTKKRPLRRIPERPRGELRVSSVLDAAAAVISEVGYDAATMTEIARRAESSIGTIYQYFRDKAAIGSALRERYGEALSEELGSFADLAPDLSVSAMVEQFVQIVTEFTNRHPAFLPLVVGKTTHNQDAAFRKRLRQRIGLLFQRKAKTMSADDATRVANVSLQILKGMQALISEASFAEKERLRAEMTTALSAYLEAKLRS